MNLRETFKIKCNNTVIEFIQGDIINIECDAIVNAANSLMIMGGGVAGAIRRAAGDEVEKEARRYAPVPVGKAIATTSGKLAPKIRIIIHSPTMERPAMKTTTEKVRKATKAALEVAVEKKVECIAFPAMGAGVGGVPVKDSIKTMLEVLEEHAETNYYPKIVKLVAYTETDYKQFLKALEEFLRRTKKCEKLS